MTALTPEEVRAAHAHAALLAALHGERNPVYIQAFEHMEVRVAELEARETALARARRLVGLKLAA